MWGIWVKALQTPIRASFFRTQSSSTFARKATTKCDVVIVGGGPTGLTLCSLLSQMHVKAVLIEKSSQLTEHPQAHFINHRSMEVFRSMQGLSRQISKSASSLDHWRKFVYCESLAGRAFGEVDHFPGLSTPHNPDISPEPVAHFSQNKLLPLLLDRCGDQQVLFSCQATTIAHTRDSVKVTAIHSGAGPESVLHLEGKYVVIADGANSSVRESLGIKVESYGPLQHLINVHFRSNSLSDILLQNPAMLYFVLNPKSIFVLVAHDLQEGIFIAQIPYYPPLQNHKSFDATSCTELIKLGIGHEGQDCTISIKSIRPWTMRAQIANSFSLGGSVFLAGDSAHVFPPAGGFGMNTGIQDAHNLAWKLAAVINQGANPDLLESYALERRPVSIQNAELSIRNWREAAQVPASLGLDPNHANLLSKVATDVVGRVFPQSVAKTVLELGLGIGAAASGLKGPLKSSREREISKLFESGNTLRLQYPKDDLGFRYAIGLSSKVNEQEAEGERDAAFEPTLAPGFRMPHFNLELPFERLIVSSLDINRKDAAWPLLITHAGTGWELRSLELISSGFHMDLAIVLESQEPSHIKQGSPSLSQYSNYKDCCLSPGKHGIVSVAIDCDHSWKRLSRGRSALIRPDGHIWWVSTDNTTISKQTLKEQVALMLSLDGRSPRSPNLNTGV